MLTLRMNDRAATLLEVQNGFGGLEPSGGLASGLWMWVERGIARRGEVICWAPVPAAADNAPGDFFDLTGWECSHTSFHLEDFVPVPVDVSSDDGPVVGVEAQRELLRHGVALSREVAQLASALEPSVPLRCITSTNDTSGTFRFHMIRPGMSWHNADLDSYSHGSPSVVEIDYAPQRAAPVVG